MNTDAIYRNSINNPVVTMPQFVLPPLPTNGEVDLSDPNAPELTIRRRVRFTYSTPKAADKGLEKLAIDPNVSEAHFASTTDNADVFVGNPNNEPLFYLQWSAPASQWSSVLSDVTEGTALVTAVDLGLVENHEDLSANYRKHFSFGAQGPTVEGQGVYPSLSQPAAEVVEPGGYQGHGSHVAGILSASLNSLGVAGVCPKCSLQAMRFTRGPNKVNQILYSMQEALNFGTQVVNLSLGDPTGNPCSVSEFWVGTIASDVFDLLAAADVTVVAASGNIRGSVVACPASAPGNKVIAAGGAEAAAGGGANFWEGSGSFGSNWGTCAPNVECPNDNDLVAPAAGIWSTITGSWNPNIPCAVQPPQVAYGPCTGTSMAAPHVSASAGLVRSVNPLLNEDATKAVLKNTTRPLQTASTKAGKGLLDTRAAVDASLGRVGGLIVPNRMTPLFMLTSVSPNFGAGARDWLYTTKPQVAKAAIDGSLYFNPWHTLSTIPEDERPGIATSANYYTSPTNAGATVTGFAFPGIAHPSVPRASAYVFAVERVPASLAGNTLVPLMKLSSIGCGNQFRQHVYTTRLVGTGSLADFLDNDPGHLCPDGPGADRSDRAYRLDTVEGFLLSPDVAQPPGTIAIYRVFSTVEKSWAVVTQAEFGQGPFATYTTDQALLGYGYANVDTDSDTLVDAFENLIGTSPLSQRSDCDGSPDNVEFPLAGISTSDPIDARPCRDFEVKVTAVQVGANKRVDVAVRNLYSAPVPTSNPVVVMFSDQSGGSASNIVSSPSGCTLRPTPKPAPQNPDKYFDCDFGQIQPGATVTKSWVVDIFVANHDILVVGSTSATGDADSSNNQDSELVRQ